MAYWEENWMRHFKVEFHKDVHCSGHVSMEELGEAVKEINPKALIPIHTHHADEFKRFHKNVVMPEKGKKMEI